MRTLNEYFLTVRMTDIGTPGMVAQVVVPDKGVLVKAFATVGVAINTGNTALTTAVDGVNASGACTFAVASAAIGQVATAEYTAGNAVNEGSVITLTSDGISAAVSAGNATFVIRR